MALTAEDVGGEGAAGDPEVVGVVLFVQLLHVQVPQSQVSVGGSSHEHLTAGAEGAGHHGRVAHCSGPSEKNIRVRLRVGTTNQNEQEVLQKP